MNAECISPASLVHFLLSRSTLDPECVWTLLMRPRSLPVGVTRYLCTFFLTCLLETPFYWLALKSWNVGRVKKVGFIVLVNLATHPFIYFGVPAITFRLGGKVYQSLLLSELFAPLVEGIILWRVRKGPAWVSLGYAIAANLFSWWVGIFLTV